MEECLWSKLYYHFPSNNWTPANYSLNPFPNLEKLVSARTSPNLLIDLTLGGYCTSKISILILLENFKKFPKVWKLYKKSLFFVRNFAHNISFV